jgi:hypothetical protein
VKPFLIKGLHIKKGEKKMIKTGDNVIFYVNWLTRKEKETIGEVKEIKNGVYTVFAYGNYFFLNEKEITLIKKGVHNNE